MFSDFDNRELDILTEGVSIQSRSADRFWLTMILITLFVILPDSSNVTKKLPFNLGEVSSIWFYFITSLMLSVVWIAFSSAHAQAIRASMLVFRYIDSIPEDKLSYFKTNLKDIYDSARVPSLNRVAPIAQILRGNKQFYPESDQCNVLIKYSTGIYYIYLKILGLLVYFLVPACALWFVISKYHHYGNPLSGCLWMSILVHMVYVGAGISMLIMIVIEIIYVSKVFRVMT